MREVRRLLTLAWPVVLGQVGVVAMSVADLVMVGSLGEQAIAGLAIGNVWSFGLLIFGLGTIMGLDPLFAQAHGAGNKRALGLALARSIALAGVLSVPIVAGHFLAGPALTLLQQPADVVPIAAGYCRALGWGVLPGLLFFALRTFLHGQGLMKPGMWVVLGANVVNLGANAVLIDGLWGAPALGAEGCGWATSIVRGLMPFGLLLLAWRPFREGWPRALELRQLFELRQLAALGLPVGVQVAMEVEAFNAAGVMMGWVGSPELAGHALALNITSLSFMVPYGLGSAAATRVGNLVGAGLPWRRAGWTAIGIGAGFMLLSASVISSVPAALAGLYTDDLVVVGVAASLLPIAGLFQLFDGIQAVSFGVLRGVGDNRVPALANLVGYWALGLPAGACMTFWLGWGYRGIWWGLVIGLSVVATLLLARVWRVGVRPVRTVVRD